jgi:hypothetical protein
MILEMGQAISEATKRFGEATREMRQATQDLQRDLNVTRDEIRRGVLELPEEAREGAEAMRRVVGDQLKALSELSEIISRHGKSFDVSTPSLGEARAVAAGGETVVAAPVVRESARFEPPRAVASPAAAPSIAKASPPRVTPRPAQTPLHSTDHSEGGWVSDLLRRASSDEETPPPAAERRTEATPQAEAKPAANGGASPAPAAPAGALGAISADIARAIDHEAAIELWARHNRGEKNLFTRRLYTLPGQQTFDEIRRRYQRDGEFKSAVDRYVADFEKLLSEVTKAGKDRAASAAYLTSDTGKVYTMLAHASGRFD